MSRFNKTENTWNSRWKAAIRAEKRFWSHREESVAHSSKGWKSFLRANFGLGYDFEQPVLEVGCGPTGVIRYLTEAFCVGVDPISFRSSEDSYDQILGVGEALPFKDGSFATVICFNAIDHVADLSAVAHEISRVLHAGGCLFLWVHVFPQMIRKALDLASPVIDPPHPHHLSERSLEQLMDAAGWRFIMKKRSKKHYGYSLKARIASYLMQDIYATCEKRNSVCALMSLG